jgi:hypothetical protein
MFICYKYCIYINVYMLQVLCIYVCVYIYIYKCLYVTGTVYMYLTSTVHYMCMLQATTRTKTAIQHSTLLLPCLFLVISYSLYIKTNGGAAVSVVRDACCFFYNPVHMVLWVLHIYRLICSGCVEKFWFYFGSEHSITILKRLLKFQDAVCIFLWVMATTGTQKKTHIFIVYV